MSNLHLDVAFGQYLSNKWSFWLQSACLFHYNWEKVMWTALPTHTLIANSYAGLTGCQTLFQALYRHWLTHSNFIWWKRKPRRREVVAPWRSQRWPAGDQYHVQQTGSRVLLWSSPASLPISHGPPSPTRGFALLFWPLGSACADASEPVCLHFCHFWWSYVPFHVFIYHLYFLGKRSVHLFCCSLSGIWALILAFREKANINIL